MYMYMHFSVVHTCTFTWCFCVSECACVYFVCFCVCSFCLSSFLPPSIPYLMNDAFSLSLSFIPSPLSLPLSPSLSLFLLDSDSPTHHVPRPSSPLLSALREAVESVSNMEDFEQIEKIGSGFFAEVYKVRKIIMLTVIASLFWTCKFTMYSVASLLRTPLGPHYLSLIHVQCSLFIKDTIGPTLPVLNTCTV